MNRNSVIRKNIKISHLLLLMMWMCRVCASTFSRVWARGLDWSPTICPSKKQNKKQKKNRKKQNKKVVTVFFLSSVSHTFFRASYFILAWTLWASYRCGNTRQLPSPPSTPPPSRKTKKKYTISFFSLIYSSTNFLSLNLGLHIIIILVSTPHPSPFVPCQKEEEKERIF